MLDLPEAPPERAFGAGFDQVMADRQREADEFYAAIIPPSLDADAANVMRQALAGMLWSKQFYHYDVDAWLSERGVHWFEPRSQRAPRNEHWHHMRNADIISMPDKWEYPWYAAWDLAFHVLALTLVDEDFGKQQLDLMLQERYLHPNGQIPAYEWNFGDVNPPVHAWAAIFTYRLDKARRGHGDIEWLERVFHKLLLNFTWWVNRKDRSGNNVFEGGFLGLDNIGVFDRSAALPTGGYLEQADGTAWMALFCQNMLEICGELALERPAYADMCGKFVEHYLWIAASLVHAGEDVGMWDEQDGFFYDVLRLPGGGAQRLKVRSMVGLLPFCAVTVFEGAVIARYPDLGTRLRRFLDARPELTKFIQDPAKRGVGGRLLASVLNEDKLRRVLSTMLDEREFLSAYGIRSLSRYHESHPYVFRVGSEDYRVSYLPAESDTRNVRRQLQLARPDLDARQRADHPRAAPVLRLLRRRLQGGMPDRLRPPDDALPSRRGDRAPPGHALPAGFQRPAARLRRYHDVSGRPALARFDSVLRVLPWRQWRRARRQPPDRMDWDRRPHDAPVRQHLARPGSATWQSGGVP